MAIKGLTCYTDIKKFKRNVTQLSCLKNNKDGIFFQLDDKTGYGIVIPLVLKEALFRLFKFDNTIPPIIISSDDEPNRNLIPFVWLVITLFFNKVGFEEIFSLCGCNFTFTKEEKESGKELSKTIPVFKKVIFGINNEWTARDIIKYESIKKAKIYQDGDNEKAEADILINSSKYTIIKTFNKNISSLNVDQQDMSNLVSKVYDMLTDTFGVIDSNDKELQIKEKDWINNY